jgi:hypothetical protein
MLSGARLPHLDIACCASVPCCCVSRPLPTLDAKCTLAASAAAGAMPSQDGRKRWRSQSEGTRAGDDGRGDVARSSAGGRASRRPKVLFAENTGAERLLLLSNEAHADASRVEGEAARAWWIRTPQGRAGKAKRPR